VSSAASAGTASSPLLRYEALHAHAELELELAGRADLDGLGELRDHWQELSAGLPAVAPPEAAGVLERALLIHERTSIELQRLRDTLLSELQQTTRARRTADGYAGQLRRGPRLDRRA
jgi:hypothetical protein